MLADWQISQYIRETRDFRKENPENTSTRFDIRDFSPRFDVQYTKLGVKKPSAGLSPHGYDCRLATTFNSYGDEFKAEDLVLQPGESVLGSTVEYIELPFHITGIVEGKSTYARQFLMCVVTPLEAGWQGYVTLELVNLGQKPVVLYTGAGICQLRFIEAAAAENPYGSRGIADGKYQKQGHAVGPK